MIDYLYYRFYRLWLHSSLAEGAVFMGMLMFSVILSTNVLTVWGMLTRYGIVAYPSDIQYYIIEGGIIALLSWRFFFRKRYDRIIARYDDESPVQRKSGAWVLALYVVSTIAVFLGQAEIPVHMLNWAVRSVKFLGVEFDQSEDEEVSVSDAAHL